MKSTTLTCVSVVLFIVARKAYGLFFEGNKPCQKAQGAIDEERI